MSKWTRKTDNDDDVDDDVDNDDDVDDDDDDNDDDDDDDDDDNFNGGIGIGGVKNKTKWTSDVKNYDNGSRKRLHHNDERGQ